MFIGSTDADWASLAAATSLAVLAAAALLATLAGRASISS